jgi:hypothetical protein
MSRCAVYRILTAVRYQFFFHRSSWLLIPGVTTVQSFPLLFIQSLCCSQSLLGQFKTNESIRLLVILSHFLCSKQSEVTMKLVLFRDSMNIV